MFRFGLRIVAFDGGLDGALPSDCFPGRASTAG